MSLSTRAPRLSVIMLAHNNPVAVARAVSAILRQLSPGVEFIVVDDASEDDTAGVVDDLIRDIGNGRLIRLAQNHGIAGARNFAAGQAAGDYLLFIDDDDVIVDGALGHILQQLATSPDVLVTRASARLPTRFRPVRVVDGLPSEVTETGLDAFERLVGGTLQGFLWNKAIRRTLVLSHPFPPLSSQSDLAGLTALLPDARVVKYSPVITYLYIVRQGSATNSSSQTAANMAFCTDLMKEIAQKYRPHGLSRVELLRLEYALYVRQANASIRIGAASTPELRPVSGSSARINGRGVATTLSTSPMLALASGMLRYSPRIYALLYRSYRRLAFNG